MKYLLFLIIVIIIFGIFTWFGIYFPKEIASRETTIFFVKKGEGAKEISINLKEENLIWSAPLFRFFVLAKGVAGELKAGEYALSPAMTVPEIVAKLVSGEVIKNKITIIEGWTVKDISDYLGEEIDSGLEGYLFPDTYEIFPGESIEDIIEKILANFDKKLNPKMREEISSQGKSIFEIIIMASLLEKEVRTLEDKKIVSGILWKRLENGIPLQVDATITYITGKKTTKISKEETEIDSPYNTYKYKGLPIGPICNPGLESIEAAIYPESTDYWFYLSTPEGKTIFSKTLEEHNIAKLEYLK